MVDESLDRALEFNRELAALGATGLPITLDIGHDPRELAIKLGQINASLSLRTSLGQSLEQAIIDDSNLPRRYRSALLVWLKSDRPSVVLESISQSKLVSKNLGHQFGLMLTHLMIILFLAYLGLICLCLWTNPAVDAIYAQLDREPDWISSVLTSARSWLPLWGVLVPISLFVAILLWRRQSQDAIWYWLPGASCYHSSIRYADFAELLAQLLDSNFSLSEGLPLAASLCEYKSIDPETIANAGKERHELIPESSDVASLPPLLDWALNGDLRGESRASALRFAAESYRQLADSHRQRWIVITPAILGIFIGGLVVMMYGLSVFLPVISLLQTVSLPGD